SRAAAARAKCSPPAARVSSWPRRRAPTGSRRCRCRAGARCRRTCWSQMAAKGRGPDRDVAVNRRAFHDYFVDERHEAGLVLTGTEVKSLRAGKANLRDGYVRIDGREAW